jgi:hypothetical protein
MAESEISVPKEHRKRRIKCFDRRRFSYACHIPERRSGMDRRTGMDRRSGRERRSGNEGGKMPVIMHPGGEFERDARVLPERRTGIERRS